MKASKFLGGQRASAEAARGRESQTEAELKNFD
jgi:hypothetical protein